MKIPNLIYLTNENTKPNLQIFSFPPGTDNQRVILTILDVNDEPPYFTNRPLPMQAVVKLNAQPNSPVFQLQARDPDKDHDIHYFLVRDRSESKPLEYFIRVNQNLIRVVM